MQFVGVLDLGPFRHVDDRTSRTEHTTFTWTTGTGGRDVVIDDEVPSQYNNIPKCSTPAGMQIMQ